jgi:protein SCO1/2
MTTHSFRLCIWLCACFLASLSPSRSAEPSPEPVGDRVFLVRGIVQELAPGAQTVTVQHEAISNYMDAMTMPFKVKSASNLAGLQPGDRVTFQLHVTDTESWIDDINRGGAVTLPARARPEPGAAPAAAAVGVADPACADCRFTNELGQAVSLRDFRGQALAITFFYTRCPLPDYCPRLSKNFEMASEKLAALPGLAVNWHFLSISFDPQFDSPARLKNYAQAYRYDPAHWSFLTGAPDQIAELARRAGVNYQPADGTIDHNFRTLIVDPAGRLQMIFPTSGDLSGPIVTEMLKAIAVTNGVARK